MVSGGRGALFSRVLWTMWLMSGQKTSVSQQLDPVCYGDTKMHTFNPPLPSSARLVLAICALVTLKSLDHKHLLIRCLVILTGRCLWFSRSSLWSLKLPGLWWSRGMCLWLLCDVHRWMNMCSPPNPQFHSAMPWKIHKYLDLNCCNYTGIK